MRAPRILFVGMQGSVHIARWIGQLQSFGWDLHFFPVDGALPHSELTGVTIHWPFRPIRPRTALELFRRRQLGAAQFRTATRKVGVRDPISLTMLPIPYVSIRSAFARFWTQEPHAEPSIYDRFKCRMLARLARQLQPDLVHSMEFQHAGYLTLWAKERSLTFPPWLATNWGSDIYYYQHDPAHRAVIERLLQAAEYYSCECERDVPLAYGLGFRGKVLPVFPNSGGFDITYLKTLRSELTSSRRRVILVKGYQHFAGRAMTALDAIERCTDLLEGRNVIVFSAVGQVAQRVHQMARSGIPIRLLAQSSHEDMLRLFGQARIYLGISVSDAISTSLLEAMAMGAFPIQTNTSCCDEWFQDGIGGFSIPPENLGVIVDRLRRALRDDELINRAARINAATVQARLDHRVILPKVRGMYEVIFDGSVARAR